MFALRDYQREASAATLAGFSDGHRGQLVVMPTGMGKSLLFAVVAKAFIDEDRGRVIAVAHTDELVSQSLKLFRRVLDDAWIDYEQAGHRANPRARVVVASIATLMGRRRAEFFERFDKSFGLLIVDEAHRAAAPTYRSFIADFLKAHPYGSLLGVTATPQRTDNVGLETVFPHLPYQMTLQDGLDRGYLVPMRSYAVPSGLALDVVTKKMKDESVVDFDEKQLAKFVQSEARNRLVVKSFLEIAAEKKGIVFCASVDQAMAIAEMLREAGITARGVHGEQKIENRRAIVDAFRDGRLQVLTNCGVLTAGFDVPDVSVVVMARPTLSSLLYLQALGRGTRPEESIAGLLGSLGTDEERRALIAGSAKPVTEVIDIVDLAGKHEALTLASLFGLAPGSLSFGHVVGDWVPPPEPEDEVPTGATGGNYSERPEVERVIDILVDTHFETLKTTEPKVLGSIAVGSQWRCTANGGYVLTLRAGVACGPEVDEALTTRIWAEIERLPSSAGDVFAIACTNLGLHRHELRQVHRQIVIRPHKDGFRVSLQQRLREVQMIAVAPDRDQAFDAACSWLTQRGLGLPERLPAA